MKKLILMTIAMVSFAASAVAQNGGYEPSWGSVLVGAIGALIMQWIGGIASKAGALGEALMDRWIKKINANDNRSTNTNDPPGSNR